MRSLIKYNLPFITSLVAGAVLICCGLADNAFAYDDSLWGDACGRVLAYIQGGFGGLLSAVAGIGAIVASAAGGFRMAWALIVVSVGAYILGEYIDIFFKGMCQ
jgi:hypothetical protein